MDDKKYALGLVAAGISVAVYAVLGLAMFAFTGTGPSSSSSSSSSPRPATASTSEARADEPRPAAPARAAEAKAPASTPVASGPKTLRMTKAEFREKVKAFKNRNGGKPWDGVNRELPSPRRSAGVTSFADARANMLANGMNAGLEIHFDASDFYGAFGKPARTSTQGDTITWTWECSDGTVEVIQQTSGNSGKVAFVGINDF